MFLSHLLPVAALLATVCQADHYFSLSSTLPDDLQQPGAWKYEGPAGCVFLSGCEGVTAPLIRLVSTVTGEVFWTTSQGEASIITGWGNWTVTGSPFHVFVSEQPDSEPLHRMYQPGKFHFFTTSQVEVNNLLALPVAPTWNVEGVAGWLPKKDWVDCVPIHRYYRETP